MLSHMGFGTMILDGYKCTSCRVWVCADGRKEGIVILSPTTAATASSVVPNVTLWFLMGDTMVTQYDRVSPESRAGRLNVSQTVTPREHFSGGYASG